jgi:predicted RNA binding protein YcfA (HicA-like mRNA interferase family)
LNYSAKNLIRVLLLNGFVFKRAKGSHQLFYNKEANKTVIVPMHGKDMPKGTFLSILKQAGFDKSEI